MVSTPLTLAALATSAVPGLRVIGARPHTAGGDGEFTSVVVVAEEGEFIVRVPRTTAAEVRHSGELLGVAALAEGARSSLPFRVPETAGVARAGDTRAVVSTFLPGGRISAEALESDALLLQPVAETIAAIHRLPSSLVQQAGLPMRTAEDVREQALRLVGRAAETRLLPETVQGRWLDLLDRKSLWDFVPVVVHGSLDADQLLIADDEVTGVLGWSELSVGDPAVDLSWLLAGGPDVLDSVLARYAVARGLSGIAELRTRTVLQHQLGVARWLLHGVESHDSAIVEDAVTMLDRLVDRLSHSEDVSQVRTVLSETGVQQLLDEMPEVSVDPRSETAEFEALDEDREFLIEREFTGSEATGPIDDGAAEADVSEGGDHPTEPVDPSDLPPR